MFPNAGTHYDATTPPNLFLVGLPDLLLERKVFPLLSLKDACGLKKVCNMTQSWCKVLIAERKCPLLVPQDVDTIPKAIKIIHAMKSQRTEPHRSELADILLPKRVGMSNRVDTQVEMQKKLWVLREEDMQHENMRWVEIKREGNTVSVRKGVIPGYYWGNGGDFSELGIPKVGGETMMYTIASPIQQGRALIDVIIKEEDPENELTQGVCPRCQGPGPYTEEELEDDDLMEDNDIWSLCCEGCG